MSWNITMPDAIWLSGDSSSQDIESFVREVADHKEVALDTETTGLNLMRDTVLYWSLSWHRKNGEARRACLRADVLRHFKKIFHEVNRDWIFCNAKFDVHMLKNTGIDIDGRYVDISVMHSLLYEEMPHGLKEMTEQLQGWVWQGFTDTFGKIDRDDPKWIQNALINAEKTDLHRLVEYASNDAYGTLENYATLKKELMEASTWSLYPDLYPDLWELFRKVEVPFTKVLWKCERNGMRVDLDYLAGIEKPVKIEIENLERECVRLRGKPVNLNSPMQLRQWFFDELGLKPTKYTKGGAKGVKSPSLDFDALTAFADDGVPEAVAILRHRDLSKLYGTYVVGLRDKVDAFNRIHTRFNQDVARTGRLSSSDPNLQNIPNPDMDKFKIRRAFTHEPGNILIVADYEQLEMRLLAAAAMEKDMIDIFLKGWDIHMGNASLVFGLPYEDIAAAKKIDKKVKEGSLPESEMTEYVHKCLDARQAAKAIGFGLNYGMGAKRLAATINRSEKEAEALIEQYMARYPTVRKFFEDATQTVVKYGYAFTLLGRRRFLPGIMSNRVADRSRAQRQASNMPIQGTAADVAKMAMIRCDEADLFDQFGWHMLSQVHDELVFEGPEETAEEVKPIIKEMMEHSLPSDLAVPLTISIGKGHTWMDAKLQARLTNHITSGRNGLMPFCKKCKKTKLLDAFRINGTRPDGSPRPRTICKDCGSQWKTAHTEPKVCNDCGKLKPAEDFPRQGMHPYCRVCRTKRSTEYRKGAGREANISRMKKYNKEMYATDPEFRKRMAARRAVGAAILIGVLQRPARCPSCKRKCLVQGHHHKGYDKKNWLNVVWLCPRCHRKEEVGAK